MSFKLGAKSLANLEGASKTLNSMHIPATDRLDTKLPGLLGHHPRLLFHGRY